MTALHFLIDTIERRFKILLPKVEISSHGLDQFAKEGIR